MKVKLTACSEQHGIEACQKTMQTGAVLLKLWATKCTTVASPDFYVKNWVVGLLTLSLGDTALCYKLGQYRVVFRTKQC